MGSIVSDYCIKLISLIKSHLNWPHFIYTVDESWVRVIYEEIRRIAANNIRLHCADFAWFLPPIWHQTALHRSCSISIINLTSNYVAQVLLGFCCQSAVIISSKSCSVSATDLLSNYVSRFYNISVNILLSSSDVTSFVYNLQSFCWQKFVADVWQYLRTGFADWVYIWVIPSQNANGSAHK